MKVFVYVNPAAAIRAGKAEVGIIPVELTEEHISALSAGQREVLAACGGLWNAIGDESNLIGRRATKKPNGIHGEVPELTEATPESVAAWLNKFDALEVLYRAEEALKEEAATAAVLAVPLENDDVSLSTFPDCVSGPKGWTADPQAREHVQRVMEARASRAAERIRAEGREALWNALQLSDEELVRRKPHIEQCLNEFLGTKELPERAALLEQIAAYEKSKAGELECFKAMRHDALERAVQQWGTETERDRFAEGFMPDTEALKLVKEHVFEALKDRELYVRLTSNSLNHRCNDPEVRFDVAGAETLDDAQYERLTEIRALAPDGAEVTPRIHTATCHAVGCDSPSVSVATALVTVEWHGFELSCEYSLGQVE